MCMAYDVTFHRERHHYSTQSACSNELDWLLAIVRLRTRVQRR